MAVASRNRALHSYIAATVIAGTMVLVGAVVSSDASVLGPDPAGFLVFVTLLFAAELRPIKWLRLEEGGEVTASWTFAFALLLTAPVAGALLAMAAASLTGDLSQRKPLVRALFNAAQVVLSLGAAAVVLDLFALRHDLVQGDPISVAWLVVAVLACTLAFVTNGVLTCIALALNQGVPIWPMVRAGVGLNLSTDGMLLALAPVFVIVWQRSVVVFPLLLVTAWAVYRSSQLALSRKHEATHDLLTDLPNRRMFHERVNLALSEAERRQELLAVVLLDLNGFKEINDRLGHRTGDLVLKDVANRLRETKRAHDVIARLGGDEFAILLPHIKNVEDAVAGATRLMATLEPPVVVQGFPVSVRGSFGVAVYPDHGQEVEILLEHADVAMYAAKQDSSAVRVYTDRRDRNRRGRTTLLSELQDALLHEELVLHYQPKVDLQTQHVVGVEALVRWRHPRQGLIGPDQFIPAAEHTELMAPFTEYVLSRALAQCAAWHREGLPVAVAVNGSARNLHDLRFPRLVAGLLEQTPLDPAWLEVEITENAVMTDRVRSIAVLNELRALGVRLSIDDFGTGYSSLVHLRDLAVDCVKIDKSFVKDVPSERSVALIVRSIVDLAHDLHLDTVAEGVESLEVWDVMKGLGCNVGQGYYIAKPAPADELSAKLRLLLPARQPDPTPRTTHP